MKNKKLARVLNALARTPDREDVFIKWLNRTSKRYDFSAYAVTSLMLSAWEASRRHYRKMCSRCACAGTTECIKCKA